MNQPRTVFLKDYAPPEFTIDSVDLEIDLDPDCSQVRSRLQIRRNPVASRSDGGIRLDGEQLELLELRIDGQPKGPGSFRVEPWGLEVRSVPDRFELETRVRIHPKRNTALEGLYLSSGILADRAPTIFIMSVGSPFG